MNNPVITAIKERRSIRKYTPEKIPPETLAMILEAGQYAPSGGNNQTSHFLVIEHPGRLVEVIGLAEAAFAGMELRDGLYKSLQVSIRSSKAGGYDFTMGAPTLVVAANRRGYGNAMADCAVALENMMLAAVSLGVGSCWVNQLKWLDEEPAIRAFLENLGLDREETVCGGAVFGFSQRRDIPPIKRHGNRITYVR